MIAMLRNGHIGQVYLLIAFLGHGCIYHSELFQQFSNLKLTATVCECARGSRSSEQLYLKTKSTIRGIHEWTLWLIASCDFVSC